MQNDVPDGEGGRERDAGGHQEAPEGRHDHQATRRSGQHHTLTDIIMLMIIKLLVHQVIIKFLLI